MAMTNDAIAPITFQLIWCSNQDWKDGDGEAWIGRADGINWLVIVKEGPDDFKLSWHGWDVEIARGESFRVCALTAEKYMIKRQVGLSIPERMFRLGRLAMTIYQKESIPTYRCRGCAIREKLGCDAQMIEEAVE